MKKIFDKAWLIEEQRMVMVSTIVSLPDEDGVRIFPLWEDPARNYLTPEKAVLLRFTGFYDRYKRPIYEGDLLDGKENGTSIEMADTYKVCWDQKYGQWKIKPIANSSQDIVVASYPYDLWTWSKNDRVIKGNEYKTPELLFK